MADATLHSTSRLGPGHLSRLLATAVPVVTVAACAPPDSSGTGGSEGPACQPGQADMGDEGCFQAGIQGCAPEHVASDGICRPLPGNCPSSTIPHFEKGCVPVGIESCDPMFLDEEGLCRPRMDVCPGGTIPRFQEGCVPVGIAGCATEHLAADGHCRVRMASCPAGTFSSPVLGCVPIDGEAGCGAGTWGEIADMPGTVYVSASAPPGGDGSKAAPLPTIAAALSVVASGGRVAIAAGEYDESVHFTKPVRLIGRCPSLVSITGTQTALGSQVIVWFDDVDGASLSGVRLSGTGAGVLVEHSKAAIEGVHVTGVLNRGIWAAGSSTETMVRRTLVEDVAPGSAGKIPFGMGATYSASLAVEDSAIYRAGGRGISSDPGTTVTAQRLLVEATAPSPIDDHGFGAFCGGAVYLEDSSLVASITAGIMGYNTAASMTLVRVGIEDTQMHGSGTHGHGVSLQDGADAELSSCLLSSNHTAGASLHDGSTLVMRGTLVEDGQPDDTGLGAGILNEASTVTLEDSVIHRNKAAGVALSNASVLTAVRALVERTEGLPYGHAVRAFDASRAVITDSILTNNHDTAVKLSSGAEVELSGCVVEETQPTEDTGEWGGALALTDSRATIRRTVLRDNHHAAVQSYQESYALIEQSRISGTRGSPAFMTGSGRGIEALLGGDVVLVDSLVIGQAAGAVLAFGDETLLAVRGSVIVNPQGYGVLAASRAALDVQSTLVHDVAMLGIGAWDGASGTLAWSTVEAVRQEEDHFGDCLVAQSAAVAAGGMLLSGCQRAGLFLMATTGSIESSISWKNGYGVVLQGDANAEIGASTRFLENTLGERLQGGDLPIPDAPTPLPVP